MVIFDCFGKTFWTNQTQTESSDRVKRWCGSKVLLIKSLSLGVGTGGKEEFMTWVLSTIGLLSRIYPAEGRSSIKPIFESIESMLKNNELTSEMEAACVYALFQLGHHLQVQVCTVTPLYNFTFLYLNMLPGRNVPQNLAAEASSQHENPDNDGRFCRNPREKLRDEDCSGCYDGKK